MGTTLGGGGGPCGGEVHCEGQTVSEIAWDLKARDLPAPPFNLDATTSLELTTRIFYLGAETVANWYTCTAGCETAGTCGCGAGRTPSSSSVTGADALEQMMTWQDADELFKLAHFVGCTRPGHRLSGAGLPDDRVSLIEIPALAISSTNCRQRVEAGEPIWYLVPDGIVQYISKRSLYQKVDSAPARG